MEYASCNSRKNQECHTEKETNSQMNFREWDMVVYYQHNLPLCWTSLIKYYTVLME